MTVYSVLNGIDPRLTWPGALVLAAMALAAAILRMVPVRGKAPWAAGVARIIAMLLALMAVAQFGLAIAYLFYPRYIDWIEPTIVAASWIGWHGGHFYPLASGGDIAGIWYGPLLFEVTGFMLWLLGPSIAASKILGVIIFFVTPAIGYVALRRAGGTRAEAALIVIVQCLLVAGFMNQASAFGIRTEPLLVLAAEVSVLAALAAPGPAPAAVLGALMGLMANIKLQGAFYVFPLFCAFLAEAHTNSRRTQLFGVAALAGLAGLVLPFALPGASPDRYLALLPLARHQGMSRWVMEKNLVYLLSLWSPMAWLQGVRRPRLPRPILWFCIAFVPSAAMVAIAASLPGGGPYNFLGFLPAMGWLLLRLRQTIRAQTAGGDPRLAPMNLAMMIAFAAGIAPNLATAWYPVIRQFGDAAEVRTARSEIDAEMRRHPDRTLEVGPGRFHDLRVIPVFHDQPLAIDSEAWSDLKTAGVPEENIRALIRGCRIQTWMLPAKAPIFTEYLAPGLYSRGFLADFRDHYRKDASGGLLDAWRCVRKD